MEWEGRREIFLRKSWEKGGGGDIYFFLLFPPFSTSRQVDTVCSHFQLPPKLPKSQNCRRRDQFSFLHPRVLYCTVHTKWGEISPESPLFSPPSAINVWHLSATRALAFPSFRLLRPPPPPPPPFYIASSSSFPTSLHTTGAFERRASCESMKFDEC